MPCRRSRDPGIGGPQVRNQCAVRMSVALCRAMGEDIFGPYDMGGLHGARCCAGEDEDKHRHITGAQGLFTYLRGTLRFPFRQIAGADEIRPHKGIVFFDDVFTRKNGTRGDHIDYWNGRTYTNAATGAGAPSGDLDMFDDAARIWFCQL